MKSPAKRIEHDVDAFSVGCRAARRRERTASANRRRDAPPSACASARFAGEPAVPKTSAPARSAICSAAMPTPPVIACMSTRSPLDPGKVVQCVSRREKRHRDGRGLGMGQCARLAHRHRRRRDRRCREAAIDHRETSSPTCRSCTPSPTAVTTPAHSLPSGPGSPGTYRGRSTRRGNSGRSHGHAVSTSPGPGAAARSARSTSCSSGPALPEISEPTGVLAGG